MKRRSDDAFHDIAAVLRAAVDNIALLIAVALAAGGLAFYLTSMLPATYEANASVVVDARPSTSFEQPVLSLPSDGTSRAMLLKTESEVVASDQVTARALAVLSPADRERLLARPGLTQRLRARLFGAKPESGEREAVGADGLTPGERAVYWDSLVISGEPNSFLVRLRAFAPTPQLAAAVANNQVLAYLAFDRERKVLEVERLISALDAETVALNLQRQDLKRALAEHHSSEPASTTVQPAVAARRLEQLYTQLEAMRLEFDNKRLSLNVAHETGDYTGIAGSEQTTGRLDSELRELDQQIATSQPGSTAVARLLERRAVVIQAIEKAQHDLTTRIEAELALIESSLADLADRAEWMERQIQHGELVNAELEQVRSELATITGRSADLIQQRVQLRSQIDSLVSDARRVQVASPPATPRSPRPKLAAAAAGVLGFAATLAVAVWRRRRPLDAKAPDLPSRLRGLASDLRHYPAESASARSTKRAGGPA